MKWGVFLLTTQVIAALITCTTAKRGHNVQIKVGIYNYIPDLNEDGLQTYKQMIQHDFEEFCKKHYDDLACSVDAVVVSYDPYGPLASYLENEGFDILETDIGYNLEGLVENSYVVPIREIDVHLTEYIKENMFPSAVQAVTISETIYALPTLLCGNFITSVDPATTETCPIKAGPAIYQEYNKRLEICQDNMPATYDTLIMGKMYNGKGGYLPDIYLDGYIDMFGKSSLNEAMNQLKEGIVDETLCERLQLFIGQCIAEGINKCNGSYKQDENVTYDEANFGEILENRNLLMFSFSEKLSALLKEARNQGSVRHPYAIASVSFGDEENNLLQYVDGIVTGKIPWENANDEKKEVICAFNRFFIETKFRKKVTTGAYIDPPTNTYLIIPSRDFYYEDDLDTIYRQMLPFLKRAIPAPYILSADRKKMLHTLTTSCVPGLF